MYIIIRVHVYKTVTIFSLLFSSDASVLNPLPMPVDTIEGPSLSVPASISPDTVPCAVAKISLYSNESDAILPRASIMDSSHSLHEIPDLGWNQDKLAIKFSEFNTKAVSLKSTHIYIEAPKGCQPFPKSDIKRDLLPTSKDHNHLNKLDNFFWYIFVWIGVMVMLGLPVWNDLLAYLFREVISTVHFFEMY